MGYYGASIKNYSLLYCDFELDRIKQSQTKEYYENYKINAELITDKDTAKEKIKNIETPFLKLFDIEKKRTKYSWKWPGLKNNIKNAHNILYKIITKDYKEKIKTAVIIQTNKWVYYLQSKIGDDNIILSKNKKEHEIKSYQDLIWISNNELEWE